MKRTVKMMALVAVAAGLAFASCQKEDSNNTAANNGGSNGGTNGGGTTVEWVDLGLPSGLLWATCNLGATTPEEYGGYYAWGETTTKEVYSWANYKYCTVDAEGGLLTLTKYITSTSFGSYGTPDNLTTYRLWTMRPRRSLVMMPAYPPKRTGRSSSTTPPPSGRK